MTYTPTTRDRYRLAVLTTTAAVAAGAVSATGWVAGAAAHDQQQSDAARQHALDAQARQEYDAWLARYGDRAAREKAGEKPRVALRQRPVRTRVTTRYVTATAPTVVGPGGTVSAPSTSSSTTSAQPPQSGSSSTPAQTPTQTPTQAPTQTTTPQPPPPPPPPTPTSGS